MLSRMEMNKLSIVRNTSGFRGILIAWIIFWSLVDAGYILFYTENDTDYTQAMAPYDLTGAIISVTLGFTLVYLISNFFYTIKRKRRLPTEIYAASGFLYFFLRNILTTIGRSIEHDVAGFASRASNFSFAFLWLIPTFVMTIFFLNFLRDLRDYNDGLEDS